MNIFRQLCYFRFWHESDSLCNIEDWFKKDREVVSVNQFGKGHGEITVKCGDQTCKFELKTYCHGEKRKVYKNSRFSTTSV